MLIMSAVLQGASAQRLRITQFVPGDYLSNNRHQVQIANVSGRSIALADWLLVTRDYSFRFPKGTRIGAGQRIRLMKSASRQRQPDFTFDNQRDFLIRLYSRKVEGNYAALIRPNGELEHGFYHSSLKAVPFLPDVGQLLLNDGTAIDFKLPPETDSRWGYFPFGVDPAVGFEYAQGEWRPTSALLENNIYANLNISAISGRFKDEMVTLKWQTDFEQNLDNLRIERSADHRTFETIGRVLPRGNARAVTNYTFYDEDVAKDTVYYYRVRGPGGAVSKVIEVRTEEIPVEFWIQPYPKSASTARGIGIRFYSAFSQEVKIKLLDTRFREVRILYDQLVYAETQNLLKLNLELPPGNYLLEATTDVQRYFQQLSISR